jgi:hypothetical protein
VNLSIKLTMGAIPVAAVSEPSEPGRCWAMPTTDSARA